MKHYNYDTVVIGSGIAGLSAARYASVHGKVALITKSAFEVSNSAWAQGGVAAAISEDDSPEAHFNDTIIAGRGLCNDDAVKILVNDGKDRINELIDLGAPFDMGESGPAMGLEGGHSIRRVLHAGGDATGRELVNFFIKLLKGNTNIDVFEYTNVISLLVEDGICKGVHGINNKTFEQFTVNSPTVILAAGGLSGIYSRTTNPLVAKGDGVAIAYNAGADVQDMEFIQFHPTAFYSGSEKTFLISEAVRGEGAYLLNSKGERFLENLHPQKELAPRDFVAKAIYNEMKKEGKEYIYLSLAHLDPERIKKRFSNIYKDAAAEGYNITKDLLPIAPAAHYTVGGVTSGLNGETTVKNLYVCGEVSATGVHGANRLASNSLLECLVFSKRAVEHSLANRTKITSVMLPDEISIVKENLSLWEDVKQSTSAMLSEYAGIVRTEQLMKTGLAKVEEMYNSSCNEWEYYKIRVHNLLTVAGLIIKSAIMREESRGGHIRLDFSETENEFVGNFVQNKNSGSKFLPLVNGKNNNE